jgi:glycosyltransferase involved in cell wall biosynthesis
MALLSVVIITFNEERNIARCLESIARVADEIVVVDSLSTDNTRAICLNFGVKWLEQPFLGYVEQKNFALAQATNSHVLSLDADEALSPELEESIQRQKNDDFQFDAYTMNRRSWYCDRWILHGSWYPDRKLRLLNKTKGRWGGVNPHDKIQMDNHAKIQHLEGDLLHYTYYSIEEHIAQGNKFTSIAALAMYNQDKRSNWFKLSWNPFFAFINSYFIKGGFLDGFYGLVIARQIAYQTFLKYVKLMQMQKLAKQKK